MQVCTTKFKVRNNAEALFVADMTERVKEVAKQYNLPITHIRFGRQVKSWGSSSVARFHVYTYRSDKDKVELWVNGHNADLSEDGRKYLEWCAVYGCMNSMKLNKAVNITDEDLTAFALKYKYKCNEKLHQYLAKRVAAAELTNTNYGLNDPEREAELAETT
jgi:hypothetical protein